jgi:hypothetical protein
MVALMALVFNYGFCASGVQTTQAAIKAQLDQKREFDAQIKLLSDQAEKREDLNREAHKDILIRVDAQQEKIYDMQVLILRELRGYSSAPSGPTFQRGVPVK